MNDSKSCPAAIRPPTMPLALVGFVLSVLSAWVVLRGARDEPYGVFRMSDFLTQVILGTILLFGWLEITLVVLWCLHRGVVHGAWLALIAWGAVVCFYLWQSPSGYVADMQERMLSQESSGP